MKSRKKRSKYTKIEKIFDFRLAFYDFVKWTGALPTLIILRLKRYYINGKKPKHLYRGTYIVVSNHVSYTDPIIMSNVFWTRRLSFVATDYFFKKKFWKILFTGFGCIPVSKENVAVATFKKVKNVLDRGHCVGLFPEGGVERGEEIDAFKTGAVMMAFMSNVPLLPIYIEKRDKFTKRQRVMVGEKINITDYISNKYPTIDEMQKITMILQDEELKMAKALEQIRNNEYKKETMYEHNN